MQLLQLLPMSAVVHTHRIQQPASGLLQLCYTFCPNVSCNLAHLMEWTNAGAYLSCAGKYFCSIAKVISSKPVEEQFSLAVIWYSHFK
jgi:hypothetical protein